MIRALTLILVIAATVLAYARKDVIGDFLSAAGNWLVPTGVASANAASSVSVPSVPVVTRAVEAHRFTQIYSTVATVVPREAVVLTPLVAGIITQIGFEEGAEVAAGTTLFQVDAGQARAELAAAEARALEAAVAEERGAALLDRNVISEALRDQQRTAEAVANAEVERLRATLADHTVRAPFDGVASAREVSIGAFVTPGMPLAELKDVSVVRAEFALPERHLAQARAGLRVTATAAAWPDEVFEGQITLVGTRVDTASRTAPLRAEIPNPAGRLVPGMLLNLTIELGHRDGLAVPAGAVTTGNGGMHVFRIRDGIAERIPIAVRSRDESLVEVAGDLFAGDRVVVDGAMRVRPGAPVVETPSADAALPPAALRRNRSTTDIVTATFAEGDAE
ncbi:efflux RND transporter periplasmic adaptor subunit [Pontivivens ytuae]|uniref:Efflux RND transporter periplasmic adaptor subunit n=1 Tax=Pontivivens ytuae TaxID=2789856 RepID=A0A7S9LR54_9RHOB|nr:efflux RND transporter periplasmic adaptor subunit [Pontivivens ytuae]QPH53682.1 efflux RND transporter periplasmic adaptor subunit [Pontivivens ytuae]